MKKKILLTGATGFIGGNILKAIHEDGNYDVICLGSSQIDEFKFINHKNYTFSKESFYREGIDKIDIVIHAGAFTPKQNSEANNIEKSSSNIFNTIHLINNLPSLPEKFIFLSTLDVYPSIEGEITEEITPNPNALYGSSKLYCEKVIEKWAIQENVIFQILRLGHIYGPGEGDYQKLIPLSIKKLIGDEIPTIYSDGADLRSFLYVDDCCRLILNSISLLNSAGPINIVSAHSESIKKIIEILCSYKSEKLKPTILNRKIPRRDLVFDSEKMTDLLGEEQVSIQDGLKLEWEYFLNLELHIKT